MSQLASAIVRRYPQAWRQRYEAEVLALLDESRAGWRDVLELARGLLVEHTYALFTDEGRPVRTQWMIVLSWPAVLTVLLAVAWLLGWSLQTLVGAWPAEPREIARPVLTGAWVVAIACQAVEAWRRLWRPKPTIPLWLAIAGLVAWFILVALAVWADIRLFEPRTMPGSSYTLMNIAVALGVASWMLTALWPNESLLDALGRLEVAEKELALSRQWAAGCHEMNAKGVVSPLADAEAAVARWTAELAEARTAVAGLGYRSRFLPHSLA